MNETELLVKSLTAKDETEALSAAIKMIDNKDTKAFKLLVDKSEMLFDFVKINIVNRIKRAANKNNYKNLISFFDCYSPDYDDVMVSVLAANADEELTDYMHDLLETGSENQKMYAAKYFFYIPDTIAEDILCKYALSDNELLALNSAQALGAMKNTKSYDLAIETLNSNDEFEKLKAVKFLVAYGEKSALNAIHKTMKNSAMAENIAAEIPYLVNIVELIKSPEECEIGYATVSNILSGMPEIIPLSQVLNFQIYDILCELIGKNCSTEPSSYAAVVLLKARAKFALIHDADEYTYGEDKTTKNELNDIFNMLKNCNSDFWNTQEQLIKNELNKDYPRIAAALDVIREFHIANAEQELLKLLNDTNDVIKCDAVATLATLNKLDKVDKTTAVNSVNDENLKTIIANYFQ